MNLSAHRHHSSTKPIALLILLLTAITSCSKPQSPSETKIIGGRIADYQPFMIRMSNQDPSVKTGYCGGSWIADGVILTAAHCVQNMSDPAKVSVSLTRESEISPDNSLKVLAIVAHPDFDPDVMHNDVALLFVETPDHSRFAKPVTPIALNTKTTLPEDVGMTTVIGWGNASSYGSIFDDDLRQVDVPVIPIDQCRKAGGEGYAKISDNEICAGDLEKGSVDSCHGDSGGPLIALDNGTPVLVGVVSWGRGCALKNYAGVYARVSSYTNWIYAQIGAFKSPIISNATNIKTAVNQHCYANSAVKNQPYADDTSFKTSENYSFDQPFVLATEAPSAETTVISKCSFNRVGLGQVDQETKRAGETVSTTVNIPALKQTWVAPVTAFKGVETNCKLNDTQYFSLSFSTAKDAFNYLNFNILYFIGPESPKQDLNGYKLTTCTTHGTTIIFAENQNPESTTNKHLLILESSEISFNKKQFALVPYNNDDEGHLEATFKADTGSESTGSLTFENKTGFDIHTWQLVCEKEVILTDAYGVVYQPHKAGPDKFVHMFMNPVSIHGTVPENGKVHFSAKFVGSTPADTFKGCKINENNLKYSL